MQTSPAARQRGRHRLIGSVATLCAGMIVPMALGTPSASANPGRHRDADHSQPGFQVVASGLDNPRGIDVGPFGVLAVAEAGRGGSDCVPSIDPETGQPSTACLGLTGHVSLLWHGHKFVVGNFPSIATDAGASAAGPSGVSFSGLKLLVSEQLGTDPNPGFTTNLDSLDQLGKVFSLSFGSTKVLGDVAAFEVANNPDGNQIDSDVYGVVGKGKSAVATDAAGNSLVRIAPDGTVSLLAAFPPQMEPFPEGVPGGPPAGTPIPSESVPTSVTIGPDGAYYVGELTGFPFAVGSARVWRVVPGKAPTVFASGFTNIIDLQFDSHGRLYVLELAKNGLLAANGPGGDDSGALIRVDRNGSKSEIASAGLHLPGGVAVSGDQIFVTNHSTSAGIGEVLRIR